MTTASTTTTTSIRILCLHGYKQNAQVFRGRIGSWRKSLKKHNIEFICINAPHSDDDDDGDGIGEGRSWWLTNPPCSSSWEASCREITRALKDHAPIHVLMGFSQGATAAAMYLMNNSHQHGHGSDSLSSIKGLVCISGGPPPPPLRSIPPPLPPEMKQCNDSIPSLFIMGERDDVVPVEKSKALMMNMNMIRQYCYIHSGGHVVPSCSGPIKETLLSFLSSLEISFHDY